MPNTVERVRVERRDWIGCLQSRSSRQALTGWRAGEPFLEGHSGNPRRDWEPDWLWNGRGSHAPP